MKICWQREKMIYSVHLHVRFYMAILACDFATFKLTVAPKMRCDAKQSPVRF
jgi:hypothetical protein